MGCGASRSDLEFVASLSQRDPSDATLEYLELHPSGLLEFDHVFRYVCAHGRTWAGWA